MGQAKQRGTRLERVAAAIERDRAVELAREGRRAALARDIAREAHRNSFINELVATKDHGRIAVVNAGHGTYQQRATATEQIVAALTMMEIRSKWP